MDVDVDVDVDEDDDSFDRDTDRDTETPRHRRVPCPYKNLRASIKVPVRSERVPVSGALTTQSRHRSALSAVEGAAWARFLGL